MGALTRKAAIVGVGESDLGYTPDKTFLQLIAQATNRALDDAGLTKSDIDGLFSAGWLTMESIMVAEYLGIQPTYSDNTLSGGSAFEFHVEHAVAAISVGLCETALICYAETPLSDRKRGMARSFATGAPQEPEEQFEIPYGQWVPIPTYALAAQRHMYQYGTTSTQLAEIAVAARKWASLNPAATMRDPLTIDDVLASPMMSTPLRLRDCCLVSDGGGAVIVTTAERAKNLRKKPVWILGCGESHTHRSISGMPDLTVTPAKFSGERAFRMAGLAPSDIDLLELYDSFTITVLLQLEDLGFCPKGEGGRFVEGQRLAPGGQRPANTSGGGLSCLHTGMFGIFLLIEAARQLRGECGDRQVQKVKTALCNGIGGNLASSGTVILGVD
ncbi:MAG: thiolase [Syntrophorhabdus sp. PtaU1.Bin153]|nr:MAG: thiolase [Syntrophorhabdus sp. PtaU1.Bin153]